MRIVRMLCLAFVFCTVAHSAAAESVKDAKIVNDRAPDCSSLDAIVKSITGGCKSDDERAIAIYNFCRYAYYHHAYPSEPGGISALKLINVYGWGLCGGQHTVLAALWEAAGFDWRYRGWRGHTTVEVFYGGRWHYFDTFLKFYTWAPDLEAPGGRTVAAQDDIKADASLVRGAFQFDGARRVWYFKGNRFDYIGERVNWTAPAFLVCGDSLEGVISGIATNNRAGSPRGWGGIKFDGPNYSTAVDLAPGYSLTLDWDKIDGAHYFAGRKEGPHHTCGDKDYRNCPAIGPILEPYLAKGRARTWSNGTLVFNPDMQSNAVVTSLDQVENVAHRNGALHPADAARPGRFVVRMASPYVVAVASGKIESKAAKIEVSHDMKSWTAVEPAGLTAAVAGKYAYYVRVTFTEPITRIGLISIVQHNQEALPYLAPGRNAISISAANENALGRNRLVVTYAYCPGWRERSPSDLFDGDAEISRAHHATWSDRPIVVQKTIDRLPYKFEIPVPTPKGKQPVYPRMVFVRREVLSPGEKPAAVPASPSEPRVGPGQVLAEVPNPWTIGAEGPKVQPDRPTRTTVLPVGRVGYVSKQGEVFSHQFVKWLKDGSNAWVLLVDFDTSGKLPELKSLASARLVLYVVEAHDRAPMQVAAVALDGPFEPNRPYDFSKLGKTAGVTLIHKGTGTEFRPPKRYEIDVTGEVRRWIRGQPAHGLAVRIVPNRSVDDGWTVRFTPHREKPAELHVDTYADR